MTCKLVKHSIFKNKQRQKTVQPPLSEKRHYSVRRFIQKVKVAIIYRTMCYFSSYICVYISIKYYAYRFPSRILLNLHTEIVFFFSLAIEQTHTMPVWATIISFQSSWNIFLTFHLVFTFAFPLHTNFQHIGKAILVT